MDSQAGRIRVGVAGLGYWGAKHITALRSLERVQFVVGIDPRYVDDRVPGFSGDLPLKVYGEIADALPEIDALVVATPSSTHLDIAMSAIEAGCHVLIEKPMTVRVADARRLIRAAATAGVVLMAGHTFEFDPAVHKLREMIRSPEFGRPYHLHFERRNLGIYREDVNVIFDLAPHDVSIANFILGSLPTAVTAWGSRHVHPYREDVAQLRLQYDDLGVEVHVQVSWLDPVKVRRIVAVGSREMVLCDTSRSPAQLQRFQRSAFLRDLAGTATPEIGYYDGGASMTHISVGQPLVEEDRHFVECVVAGRRPSTDGQNGLRVVEVLECAQISLQENRTVLLSEIAQ